MKDQKGAEDIVSKLICSLHVRSISFMLIKGDPTVFGHISALIAPTEKSKGFSMCPFHADFENVSVKSQED